MREILRRLLAGELSEDEAVAQLRTLQLEELGGRARLDLGRFLRGESPARPALPENYFDRATEMALAALETGADDGAGDDALASYNGIISGALPLQSWHGHTVKLFGNWLAMIAAEKVRRLVQSQPPQRRKRRAIR